MTKKCEYDIICCVDAPAEWTKTSTNQESAAADMECNGNEEPTSTDPLIAKTSASNKPPKDGLDPNNKMESLHEESFSVKVRFYFTCVLYNI